MSTPRLIINNLSFHINNTSVAFSDLNFSFESMKYGVVGDNGVGKTTFLKLLSGLLAPEKGSIQCDGTLLSLPQSHVDVSTTATIADVLCVTPILDALNHIQNGSCNDKDFELVDNQWDIAARIEEALKHFKCWPIDINFSFSLLSGGQKTKILLAKARIFKFDFILMDEPTNNLDKISRDILYDYIESNKKGMIVVSHDRTLLNKMDAILEITTKSINFYGGNYDFYQVQKNIELMALEKNYLQAKNELTKEKHQAQINREKAERRQSQGKNLRSTSSQSKLILDYMKSNSEKSLSKMATKNDRLLSGAQNSLASAKEQMEFKNTITASLDATNIPNGKTVLEIQDLCFKYPNQTEFLIDHFNLNIIGAERIAIVGENGCGKSTLIKIIRRELAPDNGSIKIGVEHIAYLDQSVSFLDPTLTLIDNFLALNGKAKIFDAYTALAEFQFRNKDAEKKVSDLSGGEKMRAGLAISLLSSTPPQLIILDEPTNHLDLRSIESIESILQNYRGAVLAVSHDENFLKNIAITRTIRMANPA